MPVGLDKKVDISWFEVISDSEQELVGKTEK